MSLLPALTPANLIYFILLAFIALILFVFTVGILQSRAVDRELEKKKKEIAEKKPILKPAPIVPGVPILGNVVGLARYGVSYLSACRQTWGDVFTLKLVNQQMTFLCDPLLIDFFFKAPDNLITFRPAVEQFTQRIFGLPSKSFFPVHSKVLAALRNQLVPGQLAGISGNVAAGALRVLRKELPAAAPDTPGAPLDLFHFVRDWVFQVGVEVLFGGAFLRRGPHLPGGAAALMKAFWTFEESFELAASPVPHVLQPGWKRARRDLLTWLRAAHRQGLFKDTVVGDLVDKTEGLSGALAPNMLLALLWASQANTAAATFWSAAQLGLPKHAEHRRRILDELAVRRALLEKETGSSGDASLTAAMCALAGDRKSYISKYVSEVVRLYVQSIDVRVAASELVIRSGGDGSSYADGTNGERPPENGRPRFWVIPAGRVLAVCPYDAHRDPRLYVDHASVFDPDRAELKMGDGTAVMSSVAGLAYGGGPYRCPGRFFAEREVAVLVMSLLFEKDVTLLPAPEPSVVPAARPARRGIRNYVGGGFRSFFYDLGKGLWGISSVRWGVGVGLERRLGAAGHAFQYPQPELDRNRNAVNENAATGETVRLPRAELRKLVGVKVPSERCFVRMVDRATKRK